MTKLNKERVWYLPEGDELYIVSDKEPTTVPYILWFDSHKSALEYMQDWNSNHERKLKEPIKADIANVNSKKDQLSKENDIWVLFDMCNGDKPTKRYLWWFLSKKEALKHKDYQNNNKTCAKLFGPVKISC